MPSDVEHLDKRIDDMRADMSGRMDSFQSEIADVHSSIATISQSQQRSELATADLRGEVKQIRVKIDLAGANSVTPLQIQTNTTAISLLDARHTADIVRISDKIDSHLITHKKWEDRRYDVVIKVVTSNVVLTAILGALWYAFLRH